MTAKTSLQSIDIFSELTGDEFSIVRSKMKQKEYRKGETLFHQNDEGTKLYIVEQGRIAIEVQLSDGKKLEISEIQSGNFFGEMSIFEDAPRSATCTTKETSILYSLHKSDFFRLMETHPRIAAKMMYRMLNITASRLKNTDNFLSDMVQWGETARRRAVTDDFTGLYNRRFLEGALEEQFSRAKMEKQQLSIAMVDLDHFGELNNECGEQIGDKILLSAVEVFRSVCDPADILVRYGGDEFTFIMPGKNGNSSKAICDTICAKLGSLDLLRGFQGPMKTITSSIGIAVYPDHGTTEKAIMEKADAALYQAKEKGRNRAVLFSR